MKSFQNLIKRDLFDEEVDDNIDIAKKHEAIRFVTSASAEDFERYFYKKELNKNDLQSLIATQYHLGNYLLLVELIKSHTNQLIDEFDNNFDYQDMLKTNSKVKNRLEKILVNKKNN